MTKAPAPRPLLDSAPAKDVRSRLLRDYPTATQVLGYYAYAGEPHALGRQPSDPLATRDDDLLTEWQCTPGSNEQPCVLSLRFSAPVEIRLLRLAAPARARGTKSDAPARPKRLRLHTGQGWIEVRLANVSEHQHVAFHPPIVTETFPLEITESFGRPDRPTGIAEWEVFGKQGPRRAPLAMDANRLFVRAHSRFFRTKPDDEASSDMAVPAWIEEFGQGEKPRRLFRGSSIHALAGDRLAGVTILNSYSCPGAVHYSHDTHFVVDTATRLFVSLGDSGLGSHWLREKQGQGVAVSSAGDETDPPVYDWLRLSPSGQYRQGTVKQCHNGRCRALRDFADFRPPVPEGCHVATPRESTRLRHPAGKRMEARDREDLLGSGSWLICEGPHGYAVWVLDGGACDEESGARVLLLDRKSTIVQRSDGGDTAVRRLPDGRLLIGIDNGDTGELLTVDPGGKLRRLFRHATFRITAPSGCWCSA